MMIMMIIPRVEGYISTGVILTASEANFSARLARISFSSVVLRRRMRTITRVATAQPATRTPTVMPAVVCLFVQQPEIQYLKWHLPAIAPALSAAAPLSQLGLGTCITATVTLKDVLLYDGCA